MTVKELWDVTTCEIYLLKYSAEGPDQRIRLPDGGRLLIEHAELTVSRITPIKRASESTYLLVETEEGERNGI